MLRLIELRHRLLPPRPPASPGDLARELERRPPEGRVWLLQRAPPGSAAAAEVALSDPEPGPRGAAAGVAGLGRTALRRALGRERRPQVRHRLAVALHRQGEPGLGQELRRWLLQEVATQGGPRRPLAALAERAEERLRLACPADLPGRRAEVEAELLRDPGQGALWRERALLGGGEQLEHLLARLPRAGRREELDLIEALGELGDPGAAGRLRWALEAMDVDPGHGFALRQTAALALGRLGLPLARRPLRRALEAEALDHEGRPGAGLGVQRPVRAAILMAMADCGGPEEVPLLVGHLSNQHGAATGGLHLPAMAALYCLGLAEPLREALRWDELTACGAVGVLGALGDEEGLRRAESDGRRALREVARLARQLGPWR